MEPPDSPAVDYEVTEDGIVYDQSSACSQPAQTNDDVESDPLASSPDEADDPDSNRNTQESVFGASIDDLVSEPHRKRKRRRKRYNPGLSRPRVRATDIPEHLRSLMSSATVAYMASEFDTAEKHLHTIIEEAPRASAPHRTLGLIQEERGNNRAALDYFMKAAEIDRSDRVLWKRNAARWQEHGNREKAIYCLTQALKGTQGRDSEALRGRAELYFTDGKPRKAADSLVKLSKVEPWDTVTARRISKIFCDCDLVERAITAVEAMVAACERLSLADCKLICDREAVISDLVELLVELKLRSRRYVEANMMLSRLSNRCAAVRRPMTYVQKLMLAVCQHRLGSDVLAAPLFEEFMASRALVDKHRFLLWQVADACFDSGHYHTAADAFSLLLELQDEEPRVKMFLRRATCYKEINFRDGARADLENVLAIHPRHVEASLRLQEFLPNKADGKKNKSRRGKSTSGRGYPRIAAKDRDEAMEVLHAANKMFETCDFEGYLLRVYAALDAALELRRPLNNEALKRLHEDGSADNGDDSSDGEPSVGTDAEKSKNPPRENLTTLSTRSPLDKFRLQRVGASLMRIVEQEPYVQIAERVTKSFQAFGQVSLAYPITRLFDSLAHLRVTALSPLRQKLKVLDLTTSVAAGEVWRAFDHIRQLLLESPQDEDVVYAYTVLERLCGVETDDSEQRNNTYRFLARLRKKNSESASLALVTANCSSRGGLNVQRYTVGFYLTALKLSPQNALICLCLAIQVLYVGMGRRIRNRNEVLPYALAFLQDYRRNRLRRASGAEEQWACLETDYNYGRALHQLGLLDAAANFYEKVLHRRVEETADTYATFDELRRDAAFNLVQIYRNSGSHELAASICEDYLMF